MNRPQTTYFTIKYITLLSKNMRHDMMRIKLYVNTSFFCTERNEWEHFCMEMAFGTFPNTKTYKKNYDEEGEEMMKKKNGIVLQ